MTQIEKIFSEIDQRRDDIVQLTRDLVAFPTLNPPGHGYLDICEFIGARLGRAGFQTELLRAEGAVGDSDEHPRWNVIARKEGRRSGECVHFNSHIDVVQVGKGWTVDPFAGLVRDNRVYGRGSCDMKGGFAASIVAAEAFLACCPEFQGAIEISGTADEESGGYGGAAWLAERGYLSPDRVQHAIIPEPLNKNRICLGHRGVWWAEIETKGRIAHGSMPFLGDCAVRHMGAVIAELESHLYPLLAGKRTEMPVVPERARQSTLNINAMHGGEPEQDSDYTGFSSACVPDRCRLVIDRRFLAEESLEDVKSEILNLLNGLKASRPGFEFDIRDIFEVPAVMAERDSPVVAKVARGIRQVLCVEPEYVVSPGTYDQKHFDLIGGMRNCVAYGPGILELAHQPDEWVGIDDMLDSAKVMAFVLADTLASDIS